MNKKRKFFYLCICFITILIASVCFFNYKLDPYGIWKTSFEYQVLEPNKNYVKTQFVLNNPEKYDSFIFGSSRVGHIETNLLHDGKYYNMTYSEGMQSEWLATIKTFINNGVKMKNIILGIDDFSFTMDPKNSTADLLRIPYQKLDYKEKFNKYILRNPMDTYNLNTIRALMDGYHDFTTNDDILETGVTSGGDDEILSDIEKHVNDPSFNNPCDNFQLNRISESIDEISEIISLCKDNNINLYIFFNPLNKVTYESNKEITEEAKKQLQKITSYWDFSGYNDITTNNFYWYETSHYRNIVGKMIMEKMFNVELGVDVPNNFGEYHYLDR
ncbi:hypothetical protein [Clostridium uliginosum]|uniref:SGNH/GDSL hydrolase family protein n=1 Tax=Clostridium uliginosum TaxID=119641 RepID=A0A1I1ISZ6_9CLOT|nr:hypothetical protein [Clostridium uliginosum]SFC37438.1 hypothetical protein SAMN05421842_10311 [Clostridium uliginosum]